MPKLVKTEWTGKGVFTENHADEISVNTAKLQLAVEGTAYIVAWNAARDTLWKKLNDEERAAYYLKAEEWTAEGPDPELLAS